MTKIKRVRISLESRAKVFQEGGKILNMNRERSRDNANVYQRVGSFSQLVTSKFPKSAHVPTVSPVPYQGRNIFACLLLFYERRGLVLSLKIVI